MNDANFKQITPLPVSRERVLDANRTPKKLKSQETEIIKIFLLKQICS
jgi:hypothetical protein